MKTENVKKKNSPQIPQLVRTRMRTGIIFDSEAEFIIFVYTTLSKSFKKTFWSILEYGHHTLKNGHLPGEALARLY